MNDSIILISGLPHIGKTTLLLRVLKLIRGPIAGIHTENILENGLKVGLEFVLSNGSRHPVARVDTRTETKIGRYFVDRDRVGIALDEAFNTLQSGGLAYLDEMGPVMFSHVGFATLLNKLVKDNLVIASLAKGKHSRLNDMFTSLQQLRYEVTSENRDELVGILSAKAASMTSNLQAHES